MRPFGKPRLAIVFGAFILCAETCQHVESIIHPSSWLDLPLHDWVAGAFLIVAGSISGRDWTKGRPYQAAAWGFVSSLLVAAFVAHAEDWSQPQTDESIPPRVFLGILGGLLALAICGLAGTLASRTDRPSA